MQSHYINFFFIACCMPTITAVFYFNSSLIDHFLIACVDRYTLNYQPFLAVSVSFYFLMYLGFGKTMFWNDYINVTLCLNGHTTDAQGKSRIFNIDGGSLTRWLRLFYLFSGIEFCLAKFSIYDIITSNYGKRKKLF